MNLHQVVSCVIGAVNPAVPLIVRLSAGYSTTSAGRRPPAYNTPCSFTASIAGQVMTVTAVGSGVLAPGQMIGAPNVATGTIVGAQISGFPAGGVGTYAVSIDQAVASQSMTTELVLIGQMQSATGRDLRQVEGLNLNGTLRAVYFNGEVDAIVRSFRKGGDVIIDTSGNEWLVAQVLEQWPDWCKVMVVLQNSAGAGAPGYGVDFLPFIPGLG